MLQVTANRAVFSNLRNAAGTEVGTSTTPLLVSLANTAANATAVKVDGSAVTQPVSGTVTSNAGTNLNTSALALETGGNLASVKTDVDNLNLAIASTTSGQKGSLPLGAVTTAAPTYTTAQSDPFSLTTAGALRVDGSGATQPVSGTVAVSGTVPVSGTVTANAGTSLNTSALALETGGNLASVKTDVDNLNLSQGSTTSGQKGSLPLGAVTTASPSYTTAQSSPLSLDPSGNLRVGNPPYPLGATAETASATGTTAATTATLATAVGKTTYICSLSIRANATAAVTGNATVTGTITGTLNYTQWTAPLASGLGVAEETFTPCVPASATNTAIAVVSAAPGSGGVVSVTATGYQL